MTMKYFRAFLAALLGLLAQPLLAGTFAEDWPHKQKIVIDTTSTGVELKEGASRVPLAIRLHTGNFAFAEAKPDGSDLRVVAADGKTPLPFHIEKFDSANELAVVWVQAPKLSPNAKTDAIWLYWGNPKADAGGSPKATYDATQSLVLHFGDVALPQDATGNANHARESTAAAGAAGPLGAAVTFNGGNRIALAASPSLKLVAANGFAFTAWIKPADLQSGVLFKQVDGKNSLAIGISGGALAIAFNGGKEFSAQKPLQPAVWQHVAVSIVGGKAAFFIDGIAAGTADALLVDMAGDVLIGDGYRGDIDELTLTGAARSADYLAALHGSQKPDGSLLAFAEADGGGDGESASYIGILLGALTLDGWIVIGILAVMGVISAAVMIGKTMFLGRADKANNAFLNRFRENPRKLLRPDSMDTKAITEDEAMRHSTIFRLYQIGIQEMHHRFDTQNKSGAENRLSDAALNSIRAAMDAGLVRENQRLNSQIVLLTIAISGGPFLGLLGTVVGVMITFAAIAAAGDVNVNSIAPGIAAALVATVAGLAVAIPALFGYNWLAIRIKNVSADTQVFADEFLTKSAELYAV